MITFTQGDLFKSRAVALVNPVNCVGVSGKGLALAFTKVFPEACRRYQAACKAGAVTLGEVYVTQIKERVIIHFPTKGHWREPSHLEDIDAGLEALAVQILTRRIPSVAVPALGCGNGGLAWADVKPLIESLLGSLKADITVYEPR